MSYAHISILAGGYSACKYNVDSDKLPGYSIGVNDAAIFSRCDACVSMDRLWMEARWNHLSKRRIPAWIRRAAVKREYMWPTPCWMTIFDCDYQSSVMSDDPQILNGTNSGLCAVNLAYQLRPRYLQLYGLDGSLGPNGEQHWYRDYEFKPKGHGTSKGKHAQWQRDLSHALEQCKAIGIKVQVMK